MSQEELPSCDCLNWCGDDPWLEQKKCKPCDSKIKYDNRTVVEKVIRIDQGSNDRTAIIEIELTRPPTAEVIKVIRRRIFTAL